MRGSARPRTGPPSEAAVVKALNAFHARRGSTPPWEPQDNSVYFKEHFGQARSFRSLLANAYPR